MQTTRVGTRVSLVIVVIGALALSAGVGCGGVADSDSDGLSDSFEEAIGLNPENKDSDGDGFSDAVEQLSYFDPRDEDDYPYEGGYPRFPPPESVDDEGWDEGEVSRNWGGDPDVTEGTDQHDRLLSLHEFYGNVLLVDIGAEWCGPCQAAAPEIQAHYEDLKRDGFVVISLLMDGVEEEEEPDLNRWVDEFDLTYPVIGDHQQTIAEHYFVADDEGSFSIPNFTILGRDLRIEAKYQTGAVDWDFIEDLLEVEPTPSDWVLPENADELREELGLSVPRSDVTVPGANLPEGAAGSAAGGSEGVEEDEASSPGASATGRYSTPPYGGISCSAASTPTASGWPLLLLLPVGFIRRRS